MISGSVADAQPVFEKILRSCQTPVRRRRPGHRAGRRRRAAAPGGCAGSRRRAAMSASSCGRWRAAPPSWRFASGACCNYADVLKRARHAGDACASCASASAIRSLLMAPMLWEGRGVGVDLGGPRQGVRPFSDKEIELLQHLRRPGGDRDPERAAVQRNQGGAGAADRHRRGAAGDQQLGGRHRAGVREDPATAAATCSRAPSRASC